MPQTRSRAKANVNDNSQNGAANAHVVVEASTNNNNNKSSAKEEKGSKKQEEPKNVSVLDQVPSFIQSVVDKPERFVSQDTKKLNTEIIQLTKSLFDFGM